MKVDGGVTFDLSGAGKAAKEAEAAGYDGVWSAETSHDPFLSLLLAAEATERVELGTSIAVGVRPQSDDDRGDRERPAGLLERPVHPRARVADQAAHHQAVLHGVVAPCAPHA